MKRITNTLEANKYFDIVNNLVDEYIQKYKIRPVEIGQYLNKNLESFLERNGLSDVIGIKSVVKDVLDHRRHMQLDSIMKFESFSKMNEGLIDIGKSDIEHEKVLADVYNTSLSHVELVDSNIHLYSISDFGKEINSIIFSDLELSEISKKIEDKLVEEISSKPFSINSVDNINLEMDFRILMLDIISEEKLRSSIKSKLNKESLIGVIKGIINSSQDVFIDLQEGVVSYKGEFNGFHIWEVN